MRVAVLGGGIAGLASAYFLATAGHRPVVFELARRLAALDAQFEHQGIALDRFQHVILDSDTALLGLVAHLGLDHHVRWSETGMAVLVDGELYPVNTLRDLLRFRALGAGDRLRVGLGALALRRGAGARRRLDGVPAVDWLRATFGWRAVERIAEPLLRARFGARWREVPASWMWHRLRDAQREGWAVKGVLRCGFRGLVVALRDAVVAGGGEVRCSAAVEAVEQVGTSRMRVVAAGRSEPFDAVVSTLPAQQIARATCGALRAVLPSTEPSSEGIVSALVVSRARLERFHWTAVIDGRLPFQGVVETTHVIPPGWLGGRHLVYLVSHGDADGAEHARCDDVVAGQAITGLAAIYPRFRRADVEAVYVFRAQDTAPGWTVGAFARQPASRVAGMPLYLCATASPHSAVSDWNTSVAHAAETVSALLGDLGRGAVRAG